MYELEKLLAEALIEDSTLQDNEDPKITSFSTLKEILKWYFPIVMSEVVSKCDQMFKKLCSNNDMKAFRESFETWGNWLKYLNITTISTTMLEWLVFTKHVEAKQWCEAQPKVLMPVIKLMILKRETIVMKEIMMDMSSQLKLYQVSSLKTTFIQALK